MIVRCLSVLILSAVGPLAHAADAGDATQNIGQATRAWLSVQSSNSQAAPQRPMLGDVSALSYQRYVESYKNRIPDSYGKDASKSSSGSQR